LINWPTAASNRHFYPVFSCEIKLCELDDRF
jgi:hypothetical protein